MNKKELLKPSGKTFLLGDEAVVRGALEAGVQVTVGFPGSPAAEIGDTFYAIAHEVGVYNEYSTNDLGDTSDVVLSVDISGSNLRLIASVTSSDEWIIKSLVKGI